MRHRGPDWSGCFVDEHAALAHERLAIVDPASGKQPLFSPDGKLVLTINGEIYNHRELRAQFPDYEFQTGSDCEVVIPLYLKYGVDAPKHLDGQFAFVLYDSRDHSYIAARDHMGLNPMYVGYKADGSTWFSSELKGLHDQVQRFEEFLPGRVFSSKTGETAVWYKPIWHDVEYVPTTKLDLVAIRTAFEKAVVKRLMSDVPYGVLLSGGLDSSLVAAIAARHAEKRVEENETERAWWPRLHSFSIGLKDSPDLKAARKVADFIGTVHHEFVFTVQEGLDAIRDVIYHLETFDVTTIRASTPMYLISRMIKANGVKMVLSGEGADEMLGGYLYFHKAPSKEEFHKETVRKLKGLHSYDVLRANKSTLAWGLEARVPFLDQEFMDLIMTVDPAEKMITGERMEKWIMRKAFDTPEKPYLPEDVLWRQKEQFSDGVGYSWIDTLKEQAEAQVRDAQYAQRHVLFPDATPTTKEGFFYMTIFQELFPQQSAVKTIPSGPSVACSTPIAAEWDAAWKGQEDPSGRAVGVHVDAYKA